MRSIKEMTQIELGAYVNSHLRDQGIQVVLSGGAAVAFYSSYKYVSGDIDFVNIYSLGNREITRIMAQMGFERVGRHYKHPDSPNIIEFPPGPLTVGEEPVKEIQQVELETGRISIISPTDCVKDRLAAYNHWGDRQSLLQAEWVAQSQDVDLDEIQRWSKGEGKTAEFKKIRNHLVKRTF